MITNYKPQKAKHLFLELEKKKPTISGDYMVTEKVDGWYVYLDYVVGQGWGDITSRAGRAIPSMKFLSPDLDTMLGRPLENCRLICEAVIEGMVFSELNGVFNRSKGDCDAVNVSLVAHDLIFESNELSAIERYMLIPALLGKQVKGKRFCIAELLHVSSSVEMWKHVFEAVVTAGGEGIVMKKAASLYSPDKRNNDLMKIKEEVTADLLCTDMYETTGTKGNPNTNLSLVTKAGVLITVRVGKFSDIAEMEADSPIGKVIEIAAMKKLKEGTYREPRFKAIRHDKNPTEID